ncbi:hypothetical protein Mic7113_3410 [Allocoleopsis franciscana PCC 7113]|uniref:Uncharacterized protein n=1 Tax=Allocoleopsis franciscana PCC 7113 TaxID=1173027 RepID=K9WH97_9CYAN|nr:hypothetical protein Mic7113_3410 [Allocoleopsis franciscana PCC 7113]
MVVVESVQSGLNLGRTPPLTKAAVSEGSGAVCQGLKPLSHSESPIKRTINPSLSRLQTTWAMSEGLKSLAVWTRRNQPGRFRGD